jgi:hypothetical protein
MYPVLAYHKPILSVFEWLEFLNTRVQEETGEDLFKDRTDYDKLFVITIVIVIINYRVPSTLNLGNVSGKYEHHLELIE